jgi:hypothetical protein
MMSFSRRVAKAWKKEIACVGIYESQITVSLAILSPKKQVCVTFNAELDFFCFSPLVRSLTRQLFAHQREKFTEHKRRKKKLTKKNHRVTLPIGERRRFSTRDIAVIALGLRIGRLILMIAHHNSFLIRLTIIFQTRLCQVIFIAHLLFKL